MGGYVPPNATPLDLGAFAVQVWGGYLGGTLSLVGHHDVFERLTFSVLNHAPTPAFVLRAPTAR